jgi:hypothetical protein
MASVQRYQLIRIIFFFVIILLFHSALLLPPMYIDELNYDQCSFNYSILTFALGCLI